MRVELRGVIPAVVTPFKKNYKLDEDILRQHIDFLIESGVHGLLVIGGTGEFNALSEEERRKVVDLVVDEVNARLPVLVGVLTPSTDNSVKVARYAKDAGADVMMILTPYYIIPTSEEIYNHYETIANAVDIPIVLYNIPYRTHVNIPVNVIIKLVEEFDNIVGIKQCNRDLGQLMDLVKAVKHKMSILIGEDDLFLPALELGADGGIIASANLIPHIWVEMFEMLERGEVEIAKKTHYHLLPLIRCLFEETNPGPIKKALEMVGRPVGPTRKPLLPVKDETEQKIRKELEKSKLIHITP